MRRLLVSALLGALVLTACTSDADPQVAPTPSASASASESDTASGTGRATAEELAFCARYDEVIGVSALSQTLAQAETASAAADALRTKMEQIRDVTAGAPDDIAEDLQIVNEASTGTVIALADLLEGEHGEVLWPYFKENRSPASIGDDASEEEIAARDAAEQWSVDTQASYTEPVLQAGERVGQWYRATCQA